MRIWFSIQIITLMRIRTLIFILCESGSGVLFDADPDSDIAYQNDADPDPQHCFF
jgi:hypothetical protein